MAGMKKLTGLLLLCVACVLGLGACSSLPPAENREAADYGSSVPR